MLASRVIITHAYEVKELPPVHVRHHDPKALVCLDVGRVADGADAKFRDIPHFVQHLHFIPHHRCFLRNQLHDHKGAGLAKQLALQNDSEGSFPNLFHHLSVVQQ